MRYHDLNLEHLFLWIFLLSLLYSLSSLLSSLSLSLDGEKCKYENKSSQETKWGSCMMRIVERRKQGSAREKWAWGRCGEVSSRHRNFNFIVQEREKEERREGERGGWTSFLTSSPPYTHTYAHVREQGREDRRRHGQKNFLSCVHVIVSCMREGQNWLGKSWEERKRDERMA